MHKLKPYSEVISLVAALTFLLIAIAQPMVNIERNVNSYMFFVDVTQSMNVQDMQIDGQPVSRIEYTKKRLKEVVKALPCGSKVGVGIFYKFTATLLYAPIETCANYDALLSTINHLEWRMASLGSSNIRAGLQSIASLLAVSDIPSQVIFITDGNEAAPLNVFTKTSLIGWQGGHNWLLIGVGGSEPAPIPKLNSRNKVIGYLSTYSIKMEPAASVNESKDGGRDESVASQTYEYYLSKLDEAYMRELADDIGGHYLRMDKSAELVTSMIKQPPANHTLSQYQLDWLFATLAMLTILLGYIPKA